MCKRVVCIVSIIACLAVAGSAQLAPDSTGLRDNLCLWLRMPELNYDADTQVWTDLSGLGNDAQATVDGFGGPTLSSGENAAVFSHAFSALHFDPDVQELLKATNLNGSQGLADLTVFTVVKLVDPGAVDQRAVGFGSYQDGSTADNFDMSFDITVRKDNGRIEGSNETFPTDQFIIYAARMDPEKINMWFNSTGTFSLVYTAEGSSYTTSSDQFYVGDVRYTPNGDFDVAEVVVFNTSLTDEQIEGVSLWLQAYVGVRGVPRAYDGSPADGATDVSRDTVLSWTPVASAVERDVYLGTVFDDVNDADRDDPRGVLVSQAQQAESYDPGRLEFGQTCYWRIDEVNGAPDNTIFKGETWSFTVEPLGYPIENVVATSNGNSDIGSGPENTVNGSGLDDSDAHSTSSSDMWIAAAPDEGTFYIQYEFDTVYKLSQMLVWNSNAQFEALLGYGLKGVTVEYSSDGADWMAVGEAELAQGLGDDSYTANTTVELGEVAARYVRLTVNSSYGTFGKYGLSEVRFLAIPVQAREPEPADGAVDVALDATVTWRPGREAVSHEVYLSADEASVADGTAPAEVVADTGYTPAGLGLDTTYYWMIAEVNEAEAVTTWAGRVWSFSTEAYLVVEDFEGYDNDENAIYDSWIDGWINGSGSTVGYLNEPFAETDIVHGGRQSMPLFYENDGVTTSAADHAFASAQDWSSRNIQWLALYFQGDAENSGGQLYLEIDGTKVSYDGAADALQGSEWVLWAVDLSSVGANLTSVGTLTVGVEGSGASGVVYIDDIRLYAQSPETTEAAQ